MKEGSAAAWAQYKSSTNLIDPATGLLLERPAFGSFTTFWKECVDRFRQSNTQQDAHNKIESLRQGSRTVAEYFQKLDELIMQAGYNDTKFDNFLLNKVKVSIDQTIALHIAGRETQPDNYAAYKKAACTIDQQIRNQRLMHQQETRQGPPRTLFNPRDAPRRADNQRRDATGITYTGRGEPMQLDQARKRNVCYGCGKPGHFVSKCPEGKERANRHL